MNIIVVVLTASKASADYMLTMNLLESIVPLVERDALDRIQDQFVQGQFERGDMSYHLAWENYLSMEWDSGEMKKAILVHPTYKGTSDQERIDLEAKIDIILQSLTPESRKRVSPQQVMRRLHSTAQIRALNSSQSETQSATSPQNATHQEPGAACGGCHIM